MITSTHYSKRAIIRICTGQSPKPKVKVKDYRKALERRLEYLRHLNTDGYSNSYHHAERVALAWALPLLPLSRMEPEYHI